MSDKKYNNRFIKRCIRGFINFVFKTFYHIEIEGEEHIPKDRHVIVAPNHSHWMDAPFISTVYRPDVNAIAKIELSQNKIVNFIIKYTDSITVDRDGSDVRAIRLCIRSLKERSLMLFPEGTRNKLPLAPIEAKPGLALIASMADVEILPMSIISDFRIFSTIRCVIHKPIKVSDYHYKRLNSKTYVEIGNDVLDKIFEPIREAYDEV